MRNTDRKRKLKKKVTCVYNEMQKSKQSKREKGYGLTAMRPRRVRKEKEEECPLQREQKSLTAVTLTMSERDRRKKIERKWQEELFILCPIQQKTDIIISTTAE